MDSVESQRGEPDAAEDEVVTQSDDNVLLQEFTARASFYFEDTGVTESESDITKRLKLTLSPPPPHPAPLPQTDSNPSLQSADAFRPKQETSQQSNVQQYYLK